MALYVIERLTFKPTSSVSLNGWTVIIKDNESQERQIIPLPLAAPDPAVNPNVFLCYLEEEYSLSPNDFGSPCP